MVKPSRPTKPKPAAKPSKRSTPTGRKKRGYSAGPIALPKAAFSHLRRCTATWRESSIGWATSRSKPGIRKVFLSLVRAIVFQQLATKAASTIFGRLRDLFGPSFPAPATLLAAPESAHGCGLSAEAELCARFVPARGGWCARSDARSRRSPMTR